MGPPISVSSTSNSVCSSKSLPGSDSLTESDSRLGPTPLEVTLRREFFARVGVLAARYGVSPDQVLAICRRHRPATALHASRVLGHLEDLTVAAACLAQVGQAWADLLESVERPMIRGLSDRMEEGEAVVLVRGWLRELRRNSIGREDDAAPTLSAYPGQKPLRQWLGERLVGELSRRSIPYVGRRLRLTGQHFDASMCSSSRSSDPSAASR